VVDIVRENCPRFQKAVPVLARDVVDTWSKVGDAWLSGHRMTKRSMVGKKIYEQFINALPVFLDRYEIKTATKWIFTEK
jgi:hypothetical protein